LVEHYIVVVIKLSSRYKDILDIATIWVGTERVVISRPTCICELNVGYFNLNLLYVKD